MRDDDYLWDPTAPEDRDVAELERILRPLRSDVVLRVAPSIPHAAAPERRAQRSLSRAPTRSVPAHGPRTWGPSTMRLAAAIAAALVVVLAARETSQRVLRPWQLTLVDTGNESASRGTLRDEVRAGEWIVTDSVSTVRLNVGNIGRAVIRPGSRVRVVRVAGTEHRLALAHGELRARIWAPPRFFLVETPTALAIDLGCVYTLRVDSTGTGMLHVESGEVELVRGSQRVAVPAGNRASLHGGSIIGLPVTDAADSSYRRLVARVDNEPADASRIDALLTASDERHTITLWHLLARTSGSLHVSVMERLAHLAPPPRGVSLGALEAGDADALAAWHRALAERWPSESVSWWKRLWRRAWGTPWSVLQ